MISGKVNNDVQSFLQGLQVIFLISYKHKCLNSNGCRFNIRGYYDRGKIVVNLARSSSTREGDGENRVDWVFRYFRKL